MSGQLRETPSPKPGLFKGYGYSGRTGYLQCHHTEKHHGHHLRFWLTGTRALIRQLARGVKKGAQNLVERVTGPPTAQAHPVPHGTPDAEALAQIQARVARWEAMKKVHATCPGCRICPDGLEGERCIINLLLLPFGRIGPP